MASRYRVQLSPAAARDLESMFDYIDEQAGRAIALDYLGRLRRFIDGFEIFPKRGSTLKMGRRIIRVVGFERRVSIVFVVRQRDVVILRVVSKGRQLLLQTIKTTP